jgi:aryl-alcohol dehydrogenase-like predicted oxidoreductase
LFFKQAQKKNVAVIARVPLASGMLTGKMSADSAFASDDHRAFNRHGEAFDVGETFSGVPYDIALKAVDELRSLVPVDASMAQLALRWILMEEAVSVIIPGSKNAAQAASNVSAANLAPLSDEAMQHVREIYERLIAPQVHQRW